MSSTLRLGMIGTRFMGRAHSNAWQSVNRFFERPLNVFCDTVCGRDPQATRRFAVQWQWDTATSDWQDLLDDKALNAIDICTPNHLHAQQAIAALKAGKHVFCEKPLASTLDDARAMRNAARIAARKDIHACVWFNYRRCPAIALAHRFIRRGDLGQIFHVRAAYLQDWGGPDTPLVWRFDDAQAGSGAHGDLNAHLIDLARFLTGDEFEEITGAIEQQFVPLRRMLDRTGTVTRRRCKSSVDDCVMFLARFRNGAVGSFEATRVATGNQNRNTIEINGERGSLKFDLERMNELQWWDHTLPSDKQGWSRIMCTNPGDHPYVEAYWPPAHLIGYEHTFISQAADILAVLSGDEPVIPLPTFDDGYEVQRVLEAATRAAREKQAVNLRDVR